MAKKKYKGIDLFCGIGGFRLAMEDNNVMCVFSSDNDKFAQQTYEANFHEIPTGDIKAVNEKNIPKNIIKYPDLSISPLVNFNGLLLS